MMGDVVKVKPGYARNFLLPQKKALRATKENAAKFEGQRARARGAQSQAPRGGRSGRQADGRPLGRHPAPGRRERRALRLGVGPRHRRGGQGSGYAIERRQVLLDTPIKEVGTYSVRIALHPEVAVTAAVNVARSQEEAERAIAAAEVFEKPPEEIVAEAAPAEGEQPAA